MLKIVEVNWITTLIKALKDENIHPTVTGTYLEFKNLRISFEQPNEYSYTLHLYRGKDLLYTIEDIPSLHLSQKRDHQVTEAIDDLIEFQTSFLTHA